MKTLASISRIGYLRVVILLLAVLVALAAIWALSRQDFLATGSSRGSSTAPALPALKIITSQGGLYRVTADQLEQAGFSEDGLDDPSLSLINRGQPQRFWIDQIGGVTTLSFYSRPVQSAYTAENAYILRPGDGNPGGAFPVAFPISGTLPTGELPTGAYYETTHLEENNRYLPQAVGSEHWLWQPLPAGQAVDFSLPLSDLAGSSGSRAVLRINLLGVTEATASPDHHIQASINGQSVLDHAWDGKGTQLAEAEFDAALLQDGNNTLTILTPGDTGVAVEINDLDWAEIVYPRRFVPLNDRLEFTSPGGEVELKGFSGPVSLYDVTQPGAESRVEPEAQAGGNSLKLSSQPGRRFLAVGPQGAMAPLSLEKLADQPDLRAMDYPGAGYVAIGPPDLLEPLQPLLDLRADQGLKPAAIPLQAVYDQFGDGLPEPQAIQRFMQFAQGWETPPRYLLLVGDASYDPKGFTSPSEINRLPAFLVDTVYGGQTASDVDFVQLNDDPWPDLPVGRVPARSPQEVRTFVEKTLAYERQLDSSQGKLGVLAIADGQEPSFASYARAFLDGFNGDYQTELFSPAAGDSSASAEVSRLLSAGPDLVAYFGHGSLTMWGKDRLFTVQDVTRLKNGSRLPVVLNLTCLTGLFTHPETQSLAEALLFQPGGGAAAVLAPSSLTLPDDQSSLTKPLVQALVDGTRTTLGEIHLYARRQVQADLPGQRDVMRTFMLFGDPALRLP